MKVIINFDEHIETAIKIYQLNFNLKPTGVLDPKTVVRMTIRHDAGCRIS